MVQVLLLDHSGPMSLRFSLEISFGLDSVHAQHSHNICSVRCSVVLSAVSDKCPVLAHNTGLALVVKRQQQLFFDHSLHAERMTDDCLEVGEGVDTRCSHSSDGDWGKHDKYILHA